MTNTNYSSPKLGRSVFLATLAAENVYLMLLETEQKYPNRGILSTYLGCAGA